MQNGRRDFGMNRSFSVIIGGDNGISLWLFCIWWIEIYKEQFYSGLLKTLEKLKSFQQNYSRKFKFLPYLSTRHHATGGGSLSPGLFYWRLKNLEAVFRWFCYFQICLTRIWQFQSSNAVQGFEVIKIFIFFNFDQKTLKMTILSSALKSNLNIYFSFSKNHIR